MSKNRNSWSHLTQPPEGIIKDWTEIKDGMIDVPDKLVPLFNKIGTQIRFHTISGKSETETVAHILWNTQKFFKENPELINEGL